MATFSEKLTALLEMNRWPQQRLREILGEKVATGTVNNWCAGKGPLPRADQVLKISKALNVDAAWLIDDECDMPPVPQGQKPAPLSEDERIVLRVARTMTFDEAIRRLSTPSTAAMLSEQITQALSAQLAELLREADRSRRTTK